MSVSEVWIPARIAATIHMGVTSVHASVQDSNSLMMASPVKVGSYISFTRGLGQDRRVCQGGWYV